MVYCCVPFCHSERGKTAGVSYHEFPCDAKRCDEWLRVIARTNFKVNDKSGSSVVCSNHFREEDFLPRKKTRRLRSDASPSIFPGYPSYMQPKPKGPRCRESYEAALEKRHQNAEAMSKSLKHARSNKIGKGKKMAEITSEETLRAGSNEELENTNVNTGGDLLTPNHEELNLPLEEKEQAPSFVDKSTQSDNVMLKLEKYKRGFKNYGKKLLRTNQALQKQRAKLSKALSQLKSYNDNNLHKILQRVMEDAKDNSINKDRAEFLLDQLSNFYRKVPRYNRTTMTHCKWWYQNAPKNYNSVRCKKILNLPNRKTILKSSLQDHEKHASVKVVAFSEELSLPIEGFFPLLEMVVFTLSLVRHGETGANKENVIQGQLDVPLSETGLKQANLLGGRLQNQCYTHIFSSDLLRAKQTLQSIVEKNHHIKCSVVQDPKLRERKFGELEGKTIHELKKLAKRANQSVPNFTPAGAETVQQVHQRALLFFQELCQQLLKAGSHAEGSHDKDAKSEMGHILPMGIKRRRNSSVCNEETVPNILCDDKSQSVEANKQLEIFHELKSDKSGEVSRVAACSMAEEEDSSEDYDAYPVIDKSCSKPLKDCPKPATMEQLCVYVPSRCKHRRHKPNENTEHLASAEHTTSPSSLHLSKPFLPPRCNYTCTNFMDSDCPNVSLLPLLEQRLSRISSADSDRKASIDSTNDDYDSVLSPIANVLVVSHGGLLREMIRHFVENLGCCLPGGKGQALRLSPNTGLSKFTVSVTDLNDKPKIICLLIHDKDHLTENGIHSLNSSIL